MVRSQNLTDALDRNADRCNQECRRYRHRRKGLDFPVAVGKPLIRGKRRNSQTAQNDQGTQDVEHRLDAIGY